MDVPRQIGNYSLEHIIGRGASSEVWLARHAELRDHVVAIKLLVTQEREAVRRFQREAAIAAGLRHPNIVQLHDYGFLPPFHYTVMEYIEGGSLRDHFERRGRLPLTDALAIFRQVASALDYAHARNIVHRDVSPANILLEQKTGRAVLTDFGIARDSATPITVTRTIMGTPGYFSPEHTQSATSVTHLSDIYSLGVVLYHMLAGALPWAEPPGLPEGPPFSAPLPLKERGVEGIPAEVDRVLARLLALEPTHRFPSAGAAVEALDQIFKRHEMATQMVIAGARTTVKPVELEAGGVETNAVEVVLGPELVRGPIERAHRRATELRDPVVLSALLDAYAAADRLRLRRPLLGRLARFHKVSSHNLYFYQLRVLYERRSSPERDEEPDHKAQVYPLQPELDRWAVTLPPAKEFADQAGGRVVIAGSTRVVTCEQCGGKGTLVCSRCKGQQRVYVTRPVATAPAEGQPAAPVSAPPSPVAQVLVPCPECDGRGGVNCTRCAGVGRLVQRKAFSWSRQAQSFEVQDALPGIDEAWLSQNCAPEVIYSRRQVGGMRPEWSLVPPLAALVTEAQAGVSDETRIALAEVTVSMVPLTDVVFDLGQPGDDGLYRLTIYGFENAIPPDWRFFNWERVTFICAILFLLVITIVFAVFALI